MRIYIDNSTGSVCLLSRVSSLGWFEMEYKEGWLKYHVRTSVISVEDLIEENFTEIGYL